MALALALVHCDTAATSEPSPNGTGSSSVLVCEPERGLLRAPDVLTDASDPCHAWVAALAGRAVRIVGGSGSIWSRATPTGTGLLTTAGHVLSRCTGVDAPRDGEGNCPETLAPPTRGQNLLRLTDTSGEYESFWTPAFALYNNLVPRQELFSPQIRPQNEVSVFVVDATRHEPWDAAEITPTPLLEPLPLVDPKAATTTRPTWSDAAADARVLVLGYPFGDTGTQTTLVASIGRVLSEQQVAQAQRELASLGDEEGSLAYEPEVEFFFRGHAAVGMSGSGVFDEAHRQVGVVVRGSVPRDGVQYVRALRMSYVVGKLTAALANQREPERSRAAMFLEPP